MRRDIFKAAIVYLLLLLAFILPFSVDVFLWEERFGLSVPSEPILVILSFLACLLFIRGFKDKDVKLSVSKASLKDIRFWILLYLFWFFISAFFSVLPLVSFKAALFKTWIILPCFFLTSVYLDDFSKQKKAMAILLLSLSVVACYVLYQRFSAQDFSPYKVFRLVKPFFNDHTQFGALAVLCFPFSVYFVFYAKKAFYRIFFAFSSLILIAAVFFSLSRAALLSLVIIAVVFALIEIKKHFGFKTLLGIITFCVFSFGGLLYYFNCPGTESFIGKSANPIENILTLSSFKKDLSSMERVNRWKCATRIAADYPVFGSGPASYSFVYGPYQKEEERTEISTDKGIFGNAHSEYLSALSDTGIPGLIFFISIIWLSLYMAFKLYRKEKIKEKQYFFLSIALALLSYYIHSFYNNFLDTDKLAVPVFMLIAFLSSTYSRR